MSQRPNADRPSRREVLQTGAVSAAAMAATGGLAPTAKAARETGKPNVLLIMTDQQHIDTVAARGCGHVKTPALDRLCGRSVTFTESFATNPVCSPARSSVWTGRMPTETGVYTNGKPIHASVPNIGQWLRKHTDYDTVYVGKWHLPSSFTHKIPGFTVLTPGVSGQGNLGDTSTSRACEGYLRSRPADKPFLMVASFFQPHDICQWLRINQADPGRLRYPEIAEQLPPLPPSFEFDPNEPAPIGRDRDRNEPGATKGKWSKLHWRYYMWSYYRHIEMVDAEVGRVLDALEDTGLAENTLVIFTSDHGEGLAHHQLVRKSKLYDEAVKVPMIVSLPGRVREDVTDSTHLVSGLDVVPTVCDYLGIQAPRMSHGRSLRPIVEGVGTSWRPYVSSQVSTNGTIGRMIRSQQYKYVAYKGCDVEQLFDVQADPHETKNLAADAKFASVLADHRTMLAEWESKLTVAPTVPKEARWPVA